ncbi:MAG: hypothetical protein QXP59_01605 [Saccharolobus sp.]
MLSSHLTISSLIFLIYGILSPIYFSILKNKISNEKLFLLAWVLAPHLVSIAYSPSLLILFLILLSLFSNILLIHENKFKIIYSGSTFLIMAVIIQIFINPYSGL